MRRMSGLAVAAMLFPLLPALAADEGAPPANPQPQAAAPGAQPETTPLTDADKRELTPEEKA